MFKFKVSTLVLAKLDPKMTFSIFIFFKNTIYIILEKKILRTPVVLVFF